MHHYAFQAQLTRISPVGLTPDGLRIDLSFAGTITEGPWAGHAIEGIDYLLIRTDGVAVIDARELVSGPRGPVAALRADGYVVPPFPLPPLPDLLDPGFAWPDLDLPLHGSARVQTSAPGQAGANRAVFGFSGSVNMSRGSLAVAATTLAGTEESGAALLARGYGAFAAGDIPAVLSLFAADIDWRVPGANSVSGRYRGRDEVVSFFTKLMTRSGGTFRLEIQHILGGADHVVATVTERAEAGGATLAARAVHVWRLRDGQFSEFADYYHDQAAVDAFWGLPAPTAA